MKGREAPRVFSIPPGAPFLPTLAEALRSGQLVPGFDGADPLAMARATIYLPTRRAARALRAILTETAGVDAAILPTIRALGEFDEDAAAFGDDGVAALDLAPPIADMDRLLLLAPVVKAWKARLPAHVAELFDEEVVVPVSASDAIWLARDLAALMDDIETEGSDWGRLATLVEDDFAGWWQVTLRFLEIVTDYWPQLLAERGQSNPAAHRNALLAFEAERLAHSTARGPVIAAGSTGSIPATARLLATIARLPNGAVVLPGLDVHMDERSWSAITVADPEPPVLGHPQFGLAKLLSRLRVQRTDVIEIGASSPALAARGKLLGEALRPAETTDVWASEQAKRDHAGIAGALAGVSLIEAANEREEAVAIAMALRRAVLDPTRRAALVTGDRALARRVASELRRFGIEADDSGGTPLSATPAAILLGLLVSTVFEPGDPLAILSLVKHPLLCVGLARGGVRSAADLVELAALRGGTGRPDIANIVEHFNNRICSVEERALWFKYYQGSDGAREIETTQAVVSRLSEAIAPLVALRGEKAVPIADMAAATARALEALARDEGGSVAGLYAKESGEQLAAFLRNLVSITAEFPVEPSEWPAILDALIGTATVKPRHGGDRRVAIWGALEARLQSVDTLVIGGLNEGTWPRRAQTDRFMSRIMRTGIGLEPPERLIGLAAHDFVMAMGAPEVVLSRSARAGDAPASPSRWLQRLTAFVGKDHADAMHKRGIEVLAWARQLDEGVKQPFTARPAPKPPLDKRPKHFSVTEIETLRRDPYAIYARRILKLAPLDPLIRDPNAAERGTLYHRILHEFTQSDIDPASPLATSELLAMGRRCFREEELPADVRAVWWPRFEKMAPEIVAWEAARRPLIRRSSEMQTDKLPVGATGVTLSARADRIDTHPGGLADILDYKTGSYPSKVQAHRLLSPQLALEGALLRRGGFRDLGALRPADLAFIRLKPSGEVKQESILDIKGSLKDAQDLADEAWARLAELLQHYNDPSTGYLSRALPFREGDTEGDYDHLARVLEWSAGGEGAEDGE